MPPVLATLGQKLDRAAVDEAIEVEAEADAIAHLIWRYNDALESARDAWLRNDLGGKTYDRLVEMATPAAEPSLSPTRPAGPKGPLKNRSGDPEETARAARTQPQGPQPARAAGKKRRPARKWLGANQ